MNSARRLFLVSAAVALAGMVEACTRDRPLASGPRADAANVRSGDAQARLRHGRASVAWVGDLHNEAMRRWMEGRSSFAQLRNADACHRVLELARSLLPDVERATGHTDEALGVVYGRVIRASSVRAGCDEPPGPLSIWSVSPAGLPSTQESDGDIVTGAYEPLLPQLESALAVAGSPDEVAAAADQVLAQASSLPAPDFEVLAAFASLESSSAWYWYDYAAGTGTGGQAAMSLFPPVTFSWLAFAKADFEGAIAGVGLARAVGAVHPYLLATALFGGAAIGSGIYAYHNME